MESKSWNEVEATITDLMSIIAHKYGSKLIDNAFSFSSKVPGGSITVSFCFRYNPDNRKIWAVQTIDKMIDGRELGGNTYLDHREHDHTKEQIFEMFLDWSEAIRDTINQYKDDCSYYEYLAGK